MPPRKRRGGKTWPYGPPDEPYTGSSPGMEDFIPLVRVHFHDKSGSETMASWRSLVARNPEQAREELECFKRVAADPPPDLVQVIEQYGYFRLSTMKKHVRVPFSHDEYVKWFRRVVGEFREAAEGGAPGEHERGDTCA